MDEQSLRMEQQLKDITSQVQQRLTDQTTQLQQLESNTSELRNQLATIEGSLAELKARQDEMQNQLEQLQSKVSRLDREMASGGPVATVGSTKLKAPTFDGTVPFPVFKMHFETTAQANHWSIADKVAALVVSIKGSATEVQTISDAEKDDYDKIMAALLDIAVITKKVFRMELLNRCQKANESLQKYAADIERLAHLAYAGSPAEVI